MTTANIKITKVLLGRGNTAISANYTGVMGEVTMDTTLKTLRVHDGNIAGGTRLATYQEVQDVATGNIDLSGYATTAQITAANAAIVALQTNAAAQAVSLNTLTSNAATQGGALNDLVNNAAAQAQSLTTLTANAATQANSLTALIANAATQAQQIANVSGTYGNANVAAYLPTYTGNVLVGNVNFNNGSRVQALTNNINLLANSNGAVELKSHGGNYTWGFDNFGFTILPETDPAYAPVANSSVLFAPTALAFKAGLTHLIFEDTGNLTVPGNISVAGNILPSANVTYSLGSEQFQWRDLWVSNNTIYIGGTPVRVDGGTLLVNGAPVSGSTGNMVFDGQNITNPTDEVINLTAEQYVQLQSNGTYIWVEDGQGASVEVGGSVWNFDTTGNLVVPGNIRTTAPSMTIGANNSRVTFDSVAHRSTVEVRDAGSRYFEYNNWTSFAFANVGGTGEISLTSVANDNLYQRGVLNRLVELFDGVNDFYHQYSNIQVVVNPGANAIVANVTSVTSDNGNPPVFTITVDQLPDADPFTLTDFDLNYDFDSVMGLDVDSGSFGISIDNENMLFRSGRDITLDAVDDLRLTSGSSFTLTHSRADAQGTDDGMLFRLTDEGSNNDTYFQFDGTIRTAANLRISPLSLYAPVSGTKIIQGADEILELISTGVFGSAQTTVGWSEAPNGMANIAAVGFNALVNGGINITAGNLNAGTAKSWQFSNTGNLTYPDGTIQTTAYTGAGGGNYGDANVQALLASNVSLIGSSGNITLATLGAGSTTTVTHEGGNPGVNGSNEITGGLAGSPGFALIQPGWTVTGNNLVGTTTVTDVSIDGYGTYTVTTDTSQVMPFWYNDVYTFTSNTPSYSNLVVTNGNVANQSTSSEIQFVANSSGDGYGLSTIRLVPYTQGYDSAIIIIDPTYPNHIHIRAGGEQDNSPAQLFLGGENSYVSVDSGLDPNVYIRSNNNDWTFGTDGNLTLGKTTPHGGINRGIIWDWGLGQAALGFGAGEGSNSYIRQTDNGLEIHPNEPGAMGDGDLRIRTGNVSPGGTSYDWIFNGTGVLTLPGEGVLRSLDDTVTLASLNTTTGNINSVYLGSGGGVGFFDQAIGGNWLEIFRSGSEPEIRVPVGRGNLHVQTAEGVNVYNWTFDNTGTLIVPDGSAIRPLDSNAAVGGSLTIRAGDSVYEDSGSMTIRAGDTIGAGGAVDAGSMVIRAGTNVTGTGGQAQLEAGSTINGNAGDLLLYSGQTVTGAGGNVAILAGTTVTGDAGSVNIESGEAVSGDSGNITITARGTTTGNAGGISLTAGSATTGPGGSLLFTAGSTVGGDGGDITLISGDNNNSGSPGVIRLRTVNAAVNQDWIFDNGNLTFPSGGNVTFDASAVSTIDGITNISATGTIGANVIQVLDSITTFGASPAPIISGFRSIATTGSAANEGNISASGNLVASQNAYVTANVFAAQYYYANGVSISQSIQNGTSNVRILSSGGLVSINVGSVSNIALFTTTGASIGGTLSSSGFTATGAVTLATASSNINIGSSQTTGNVIVGGTAQTGTILIGQSTYPQTINIGHGVTGSGNTKTIQIGENGAAGSTTLIDIGPASATGTVTFNTGTVVTIANTGSNALSVAGSLTVTGNITQQSAYYETYANVTNSGGNLTCNFVNGGTFYATLTANVTANFTNVALTTGTIIGATIIVDQGATPYQISNVQVNGGGIQTVKWAGGVGQNPGTGSNTDVMSFSLINLGGDAWRVLGQIANYG